jgi:hypothetical protein
MRTRRRSSCRKGRGEGSAKLSFSMGMVRRDDERQEDEHPAQSRGQQDKVGMVFHPEQQRENGRLRRESAKAEDVIRIAEMYIEAMECYAGGIDRGERYVCAKQNR